MNIGESLDIGPYTVRCVIRMDNPAFGRYLIFKGERLIGCQFSMPSRSDCDWYATRTVYARPDENNFYRFNERQRRRGRPSKAEAARRELEEASAE